MGRTCGDEKQNEEQQKQMENIWQRAEHVINNEWDENRQKSSKYEIYKKRKCGESLLVTEAGDGYTKIVA